jgi:RNA polymerase sigma-70 factor, ECF subfamily
MIPKLLKNLMKPPAPMEDAPQPLDAGELTQLLMRWETADAEARARAIALMYPELKRLAEIHMHRERHDHTLQPTALVNEFFLQMARQQSFRCRNRAHFVAIASRAMRRLLVDYSRAHTADKRGGGAPKVQMDGMEAVPAKVFDILEINEALDQLAAEEPRMARVVELRCFGGLTYSEIAEVLEVDERTAKRDWQVARAWLFGRLRKGSSDAGRGMGTD